MKFSTVLAKVTWLLLSENQVTYRRIRREFNLDSSALEDVRHELIQIKKCAIDQNGEFLVWAGTAERASSATPSELTPVNLPHLEHAQPAAADIQSPTAEHLRGETAPPSNSSERRPLTVMFCDLADSTALSTQLDPEDLQDVIRTYQETCTRHIQEYEGFVAKYMGDGILVYYGYPKSLERNAERAVRSALDIVDAMTGLNNTLGKEKGIEIAVRIGIATGTVMVGEIVGEGMAQERTVIGEAPNMAARLQGLAARDGIVIGSLTRELTSNAFVCEDMGSHELKGISGTVQAWGVTGLRIDDTDRNLPDDHDVFIAPVLVGRDEEIGLLRRAWQSTKDEGRGQVVTITGEAGIGKSSLIDGLKADVRSEGFALLTLRCSPYHTNSALHPVIEHLKRLARWEPDDDPTARLEKLERMLERYSHPTNDTVPLMAALLSLEVPEDSYPALTLSPLQQKQQTQDLIIGITMEVAENGAFLQLWEDLHWADPSTLELISLLIEQTPTAPLLMLMTARPEFVPPWPMRSHITPITLNRLERAHAVALISRLVGNKSLPNEVVDHIVTKTDGVPLYVEELTKTILVSDLLHDTGERFELSGPLASLAIPDTLQASLMARLDRLPQVRELAQLASVLGREFAYEMISGISMSSDTILQDGLGKLVDAELLYQRGRPPQAKYIFKHALVQDAAYNSLLRRSREKYHSQVAKLLETDFSEVIESNPEIVARHYGESGEAGIAADYFLKAGERAVGMSANDEAVAHLKEGLRIVATLPEGADRNQRELDLLLPLGLALIAIKGYASPDVEPTYLRALELCREMGDVEKEFSVVQGLSVICYVRSDLHKSRDLAEQLVVLANSRKDPGPELAAKRSLGYALAVLGEIETARELFDNVTSSYDLTVHSNFALSLGGADFGVGSYGLNTYVLFALGFPDQAKVSAHKGLQLALELNHPLSEAFARLSCATTHLLHGEPELSREHGKAGVELASEKGFVQYNYWIKAPLYSALLQLNEGEAAYNISAMRETLAGLRDIGSFLFNPYWQTLLASAYGRNGQADVGLILVADAFEVIAQSDERIWEAELHRIKGELLLQSDSSNTDEAEICFIKAIEVAQSQNAKGWELRAMTSLARLLRDQGNPDDALNLLKPVYNWFTEGFDTVDLKDAKSLLDELA